MERSAKPGYLKPVYVKVPSYLYPYDQNEWYVYQSDLSHYISDWIVVGLRLWCSMHHSTLFQLYRGDQIY
jgi:hypothetical protein